MYEAMTPELIQRRMVDRLDTTVLTGEGSYTELVTKPVACELSEGYHQLDAAIPISFPDETSGKYLHMRAAEFGIFPKEGVKALVTLRLTGTAGGVIPKGTLFETADKLRFAALSSAVIGEDGTAAVVAEAEETGTLYNIPAGSIIRPVLPASKLDTVTNPEAAEGGTNPETDESLYARLCEYRTRPITSGNAAHFEFWAKSVNGVGQAKCVECWDGAGTVLVIITDMETRPATEELRQACWEYIEEQRPVGAEVTVKSAEGVPVTISAEVSITTRTTAEAVQAALSEAVQAYIKRIAFTGDYLSYNRVAWLLMSIEDVQDYRKLTINGGTENIWLTREQVPVPDIVEVTAYDAAS